ncbi:peptidase S1 [Streptomyces griseocarneus]|nr:peptidase S1 [Streptomyces griseocarneus]
MSLVAAPAANAETTPTPVGGGSGIVFQSNPGSAQPAYEGCTLTAVGRDKAGNLVGLTNAHCFTDAQGNKQVGNSVYLDPAPAGTAFSPASPGNPDLKAGPIGTVTYVGTPNHLLGGGPEGLDVSVIKLDESRVAPTDTIGGVTIKSIGAPPANGVRMCKQGHSTGLTCGIKLGTHDIWFTHLIWTWAGDSGSPVVDGTTLVGNAWGVQHSSSILDVIDELNANGGVGAGFHLAY